MRRDSGALPGRRGPRGAGLAAVVLVLVCAAGAGADFERELGRLLGGILEQQYGLSQNPALQDWVEGVGEQVAQSSRRRDVEWRFAVLNSGQVNAWALPGGRIYCAAGLLGHVDAEDDLAGVLAHEVAHLDNRDFQRILERQALFLVLVRALDRPQSRDLARVTQAYQIFDILGQSRRHESQADALGVELAVRAGYDPQGLARFMQRSAAVKGEWGLLERLTATHPHPRTRLEAVEARIAEQLSPAERVALARSLAGRARYRQALSHLRRAAEDRPELTEASLEAGGLYLRQGRAQAAAEEFRRVLEREPDHPEAQAGLEQAEAAQPVRAEGWEPPQELRERLDTLLEQAAAGEEERQRAQRLISAEIERLRRNDMFNRAVAVAQTLLPYWRELSYLALLAQAGELVLQVAHLADQVVEMRWVEHDLPAALAGEARSLLREGPEVFRAGEAERAAEYLGQAVELEREHHQAALDSMARTASSARRLAGQVSPILLELSAGDQGTPYGRLSFSHLAVLQAQLTFARDELTRAQAGAAGALNRLCAIKLALLQAQLARLGATASPAEARIYAEVVGRRCGETPEEVQARWQEAGDLGRAAGALVAAMVAGEEDKARPGRKGLWDEEAYAAYAVARLLARGCEQERVSGPGG